MLRENYFNDPKKLINQPGGYGLGMGGSGYGGSRGGMMFSGGGRGGYRKYDDQRDDRHGGGGYHRDNMSKRYVDYDDPSRYKDLQ